MTVKTFKAKVICPDSRVRTADVVYSKLYKRMRYSVRVSGKRVTGDGVTALNHPDVMTNLDMVVFTPDPYLMNSNAFN